jgi:hypothetical protein
MDLSLMANKGWMKRFDEPIVLDDGTTLATLREAVATRVSSRNKGSNGGFSLFGELPYAGPCLSKG